MYFDLPPNKPILVIANYRTGSTALCNLIAKQTGYINLDEHFHPKFNRSYKSWRDKLTVIKIQPDHQVPPHHWNELLDKSYVIGITRRDIVEQIASFYLCHKTQIWHEKQSSDLVDDYLIDIDEYELEDQFRYISDLCDRFQNLTPYCSKLFYYEDISKYLNDSEFRIKNKPRNYNMLIDNIKELVNNQ
jgi:LPS sulfotransferase NodH